ncbi:MAG: two-component system, OmpR family, operon response regulator KdpE [Bryobacterales bacterium]|jgi:two-component system KDP operon response regulator KdpE|nr:two-component system, OmpR family, operon response regulator KdpE [Bryobacterales bacterium]
MNSATILVVDDEPQLRRTMKATLTDLGYSVIEAKTGEEALEKMRSDSPDLVLLDLNMPGIGGLETCRAIRETADTPVIVLSVRNTERDKVQALDAGADDYVTKPFGIQELLARVRAAMRRVPASGESGAMHFESGDLAIDFECRRVTLKGNTVRLTPKEFDLLKFLVDHANKPIPHRKLLQTVWGPDYGDEVEYLRVVVNQLRKKIEPQPSKPQYLLTEPWVGYRFAAPEQPS